MVTFYAFLCRSMNFAYIFFSLFYLFHFFFLFHPFILLLPSYSLYIYVNNQEIFQAQGTNKKLICFFCDFINELRFFVFISYHSNLPWYTIWSCSIDFPSSKIPSCGWFWKVCRWFWAAIAHPLKFRHFYITFLWWILCEYVLNHF